MALKLAAMKIRQVIVLSAFFLIPGLISGFVVHSANRQTCIIHTYIKSWGIVRHHLEPGNFLCGRIDSLGLSQIKVLTEKPTKRVLNKCINELLSGFTGGYIMHNGYSKNDDNGLYFCDNSMINAGNRKLLGEIATSAKSSSTCGLTQANGSENILFEPVTFNSRFKTNTQDRLFSLAVYWNVINYYYPFRDSSNYNWDTVLEKFIPKILNCRSEREYHLALLELASLTNDGHSNIQSSQLYNYWGYFRIPVSVELIDEGIFINFIYERSLTNKGLKTGDQILAIDNITFEEFALKNLRFMSGPDHTEKFRNLAAKFLYCKSGDSVIMTIKRKDEIVEIFVDPIHQTKLSKEKSKIIRQREAFTILQDSIAYLDLSITQPGDLAGYFKQFGTCPAIILDVRHYPNDILDSLAKYFFDKPRIVSTWRSPDLTHPGEFAQGNVEVLGISNDSYYKGQIALLVNYGTFSMGEYLAMAMQSLPNTITIGQKTSGTDGNVSKFNLPGGIKANFTCLKILYPNGRNPYRKGIKLDYLFIPQQELLKEDSDPELSFAVSVISGQLK